MTSARPLARCAAAAVLVLAALPLAGCNDDCSSGSGVITGVAVLAAGGGGHGGGGGGHGGGGGAKGGGGGAKGGGARGGSGSIEEEGTGGGGYHGAPASTGSSC